MELSRLRRMARARWWIIVIAGLIGAVAAYAFIDVANTNIEPRWSAVATVEFSTSDEASGEAEPASGGRGGSGGADTGALSALVESAEALANEANAAIVEEGGGQIVALPNAGRVEFQATAANEEAAFDVVDTMRENFRAVDPTALDVEATIAALVEEAAQIQDQLAAYEPPPPPEEPEIPADIQAKIDVLGSRIGAVTSNVGAIQTEIQDELAEEEPDEEFLEEKQAELEFIEAQLAALKAEQAALTPDPPEEEEFELTAAQELEKAAATARLQEIGTQYQELLALEDGPTETSEYPDVVTTDETPAETSPLLAGFIGLLGGFVLGFGAIIFIDRVREAVWTPGDMDKMPVLAEMPQSATRFGGRRYRTARQGGVRTVRSAVLGLFHAQGPSTVGFTGLGATDQAVTDLVYDVAVSLADVGRSVLLIDGNIGALASHRDLVSGGTTLADLIAHDSDEMALSGRVGAVLEGTVQPVPNLHVLPGDPRSVDPVDTLASKSFRELTQLAAARFDVVMVVGPAALSPFAYVMTGLVSAYVVVATTGRTRQQHIRQLATQFAGGKSRLVGAVLLGSRPRRGWVPTTTVGTGEVAASQIPLEPGLRQIPLDEEQGLLDRLGQSLASLAGDNQDQ